MHVLVYENKDMIGKKLLVLDASFSYEAITHRNLYKSITCRDLNGYFEHVWSVHPFASLVTTRTWDTQYGRPIFYNVNKSHTFIEGKIGRFSFLKKISAINFILAQLDIILILIKLIRNEKIKIIRVGDPLYLGMMGWVLSKLTGVPFLVRVGANNEDIRETTGNRMMPRLFKTMNQERWVENFVFRRANMIAAANNNNLQFAINSGAPREKSTIFRYGNLIDLAHFVEPSNRSLPIEIFTKKPFLLCIARLEVVKKVDDVIRVLSTVRSSGFDLNAIIVGDGRERKKIENLTKELGVFDSVFFCGNKDQDWLAKIIPIAEVVLSPHTGRALTEAALGGAPIVAYDVDWQSELIESGVTGELIPFGDWNQLSQATIKMLEDRNYAKIVGKNVRNKALEMMDPDKLNMHEIENYNSIISQISKK